MTAATDTAPCRARRAARRTAPRLAAASALALASLAGACGPVPADAEPPAEPPVVTDVEPPRPEAVPTRDDPLAGTWWVLAPELPIRAFRMNLVPAEEPDGVREGHWVSFDWQATTQEERLVRRSKPVAIRAREEGEVLLIEGPSPMLTDRGEPNGRRGSWRLELRRTNMPGEPVRLAGRAVHTELTGPQGVPVELSRGFRTWSRG